MCIYIPKYTYNQSIHTHKHTRIHQNTYSPRQDSGATTPTSILKASTNTSGGKSSSSSKQASRSPLPPLALSPRVLPTRPTESSGGKSLLSPRQSQPLSARNSSLSPQLPSEMRQPEANRGSLTAR